MYEATAFMNEMDKMDNVKWCYKDGKDDKRLIEPSRPFLWLADGRNYVEKHNLFFVVPVKEILHLRGLIVFLVLKKLKLRPGQHTKLAGGGPGGLQVKTLK